MDVIVNGIEKKLTLKDPTSNVDWSQDLVANYTMHPIETTEDGTMIMSEDEYYWWAAYLPRHQEAMELIEEMRGIDFDLTEKLLNDLNIGMGDLADYPGEVDEMYEYFEAIR